MPDQENIMLRSPILEDGMAVFRLVERCPPLDVNSSYCNLLHCSHFSNTSVSAVMGQELVGFISGYIVPERQDTLFVWQVAVDQTVRGRGLASRMLEHILERPQCESVHYLETTITEANQASWALFESFANKLKADLQSSVWLDEHIHFGGQHNSETLVRIGPFNSFGSQQIARETS